MHTPIKHALVILAIVASLAAALPSTAAVDSNDLGRAVGHHEVGDDQAFLDTFNSCDDGDQGSTIAATLYDELGSSVVRAGDQGIFNSCVYVFSGAYCSSPGVLACEYVGEEGMPYRIAANGDSFGSYSRSAEGLGLYACFYDAAGAQIQCDGGYDAYMGDLVGTVPAGAAHMLVGSSAGSLKVTWWFGCDSFYYVFSYGVNYCA